MNPAEFIDLFLRVRGLTEPDGRRLFEYQCRDGEYRALRTILAEHREPAHLRQQLDGYGQPLGDEPEYEDKDLMTMAAFVLYGAEWFGRSERPPRRTWRRMLANIQWNTTDYPEWYGAIVRGLNWWRTAAIRTPTKTLYFDTLAYQGGGALEGLLVMDFRLVDESHDEVRYAPANAPAGFVTDGIRLKKRTEGPSPRRISATFDLGRE